MKIAMALAPHSLTKAKDENDKYVRDTVMKRINNKYLHGRGDFMDAMLKHRGEEGGLTDEELIPNGSVLILAGSETTATLLSGVTYWLMRTPEVLHKVTNEVRSAFDSEDEINFANATTRLPYMLACLEEGLTRYPTVPSALLRWTPAGHPTEIAGLQVPENVSFLSFRRIKPLVRRLTVLAFVDHSLGSHVGRLLVTTELPRPRSFPSRTLAPGIRYRSFFSLLQ